jgi:hypothetical protein
MNRPLGGGTAQPIRGQGHARDWSPAEGTLAWGPVTPCEAAPSRSRSTQGIGLDAGGQARLPEPKPDLFGEAEFVLAGGAQAGGHVRAAAVVPGHRRAASRSAADTVARRPAETDRQPPARADAEAPPDGDAPGGGAAADLQWPDRHPDRRAGRKSSRGELHRTAGDDRGGPLQSDEPRGRSGTGQRRQADDTDEKQAAGPSGTRSGVRHPRYGNTRCAPASNRAGPALAACKSRATEVGGS